MIEYCCVDLWTRDGQRVDEGGTAGKDRDKQAPRYKTRAAPLATQLQQLSLPCSSPVPIY